MFSYADARDIADTGSDGAGRAFGVLSSVWMFATYMELCEIAGLDTHLMTKEERANFDLCKKKPNPDVIAILSQLSPDGNWLSLVDEWFPPWLRMNCMSLWLELRGDKLIMRYPQLYGPLNLLPFIC